jgi:hypothetical protein
MLDLTALEQLQASLFALQKAPPLSSIPRERKGVKGDAAPPSPLRRGVGGEVAAA